jgi:hypothetical protein
MAKFFVEPSVEDPKMLVYTDGVNVAEALSAQQPEWKHIRSVASWFFDSSGVNVTTEQAEAILKEWGAPLPA